MLNIIQNTIGAIRRVGESVVRAGLKMWLPFTKAEPLGENLVVNGDFSTGITGWTPDNANLSYSNNSLKIEIASNGFAGAYQSIITEAGKEYKFEATFSDPQGNVNNLFLYAGTSTSSGNNLLSKSLTPTTSTASATFVATTTTTYVYVGLSFDATESVEVDNISVEEYAQETPDISGNDNNAILKTGKALVFAGNDSVETSFPSSKTIKAIAFWIYPTHSASFETLFNLGITNIPVSNLGDRVIELNHLTIRNRQHFPLNFDVYIDGVYRGETNWNGDNPTLEINQWQRVVLVNSNGTSTVNDTFDIAYTGSGSHGRFKMSDLQIYGADWTTDDIDYDYANPQKLVTDNASSNVTLNDLQAWWHMSEGDGTIAFDSAPLIGKEEIVNGDFSTDSNWDIQTGSGWLIDDGKAVNDGTAGNLSQVIPVISGKVYQITITITDYVSGTVQVSAGGNPRNSFTANGTYKVTQTADSNTTFYIIALNGFNGAISNVSLKEVYNIDGETYDGSSLGATYDDAQERIPQLGMMNWSKGSNLFEYSEDLSQNYWIKNDVTVTLNDAVAPDGTMSASKLSFAASSYPQIYNNTLSGLVVGELYTASFYVKSDGTTQIQQETRITGITPVNPFTATSEWQRVEFSFTATLSSHTFVIYTSSGTAPSSSFYVWGLQMEKNSSATAYRRTNGTAVTDATLISCATDSQKDILGNAVRVKGSGFNLDGTGYGEVLHNTDFDFGTGDFSVSVWVKYSYTPKGSSYNAIYTNGGQVNAIGTFSIGSLNPNKIRVLVNDTDCTSTTLFNQGEWVHIVATRNSGTISLYINGNKTPEDTATNSDSVISNLNPRIGYDGNYTRYYHDVIDDVQVYDRYLTPDEVEQNYNATKSGHNN